MSRLATLAAAWCMAWSCLADGVDEEPVAVAVNDYPWHDPDSFFFQLPFPEPQVALKVRFSHTHRPLPPAAASLLLLPQLLTDASSHHTSTCH